MARVETAQTSKMATETTVEKLIEVMGVNVLNDTELRAKAGIISEYMKKTAETCKRVKIRRNDIRNFLTAFFGMPGVIMFLAGEKIQGLTAPL